MKLTNRELKEPLMKTWGRIRAIAGDSPYGYKFDKKPLLEVKARLKLLIEKMNKDLQKAKIEENFFK